MKVMLLNKNVPWDNSYKNIPRFKSRGEQENYFNLLTNNSFIFSAIEESNFTFGDGLYADVKVDFSNIYLDCQQALQCNYLVVEHNDAQYFYFILKAQLLNKNVALYALELDIFNTYLLGVDYTMENIYFKKAHCDRFMLTKNRFNLNPADIVENNVVIEKASKVFNIDRMQNNQYQKYITNVDKKNYLYYDNENPTQTMINLNNELNKINWVYCFITDLSDLGYTQGLSNSEKFLLKETDVTLGSSLPTLQEKVEVRTPYYVLAFPAVGIAGGTTNFYAYVQVGDSTYAEEPIDSDRSYTTLANNTGCLGFYISKQAPFNFDSTNFAFNSITYNEVVGTNLKHITFPNEFSNTYSNNGVWKPLSEGGAPVYLMKSWNKDYINFQQYNILEQGSFEYTQNDTNPNANFIPNLEPKMYQKPYFNVQLKTTNNEGMEYDLTMLNSTSCKLKHKEVVFAESTKAYDILEAPNETNVISTYKNYEQCNFGNTYINNYTIPFSLEKYSEYIQSHKNSLIISSASSAVPTAIFKSAKLFANLEDLKNQPDSVKSLNNNLLHDMLLGTLAPYIVTMKINDTSYNNVFMYYHRYGYEFNNYDDLSTRLNCRYWFNYVKCDDAFNDFTGVFSKNNDISTKIQTIGNKQMNVAIKDRISSVLTYGTTFWNYHNQQFTFNINVNNIETRLATV